VGYEAKVYTQLLRSYPRFRPACHGAHTDATTGETWLVLEYIDQCVPVIEISAKDTTCEPAAQVESARWIGRFHAAHESGAANSAPEFLKRYDNDYYRGWCRRTAKLTRPLHSTHSWLPKLCKKEDEWLAIMSQARRTVIHGEYYGKTLLFREGAIFPIDWESTAIAAGEIDLAALTEGRHWPARVVEVCERAYCESRWPAGSPPNFRQTLDAARIYLHYRWLGERPDWTFREKSLWRYDHLKAAAERLSLI
jgi:thiamine kinase-like enzyme